MTRHGLGGSMILKNSPLRGSMIVKTRGVYDPEKPTPSGGP